VASWSSRLSQRLRFGPLEPWQRDQYLVVLTVALVGLGSDISQPFLPLYVRELGVSDLHEAAFWSGLVVGVGPLCSGLMGPVWGSMADRFGRKPMVLRALVMISLMQFAISFVPNVQWLLTVRFIHGLFAGYTPMAMALAISIAPRERMANAIGMVQAAGFVPTAIGPTIGGLFADAFGLRVNFMVTGLLIIAPALFLFFVVQESTYTNASDDTTGSAEPAATPTPERGSLLHLVLMPGFATALAILFMSRITDKALPPILPLYLVEVNTPSAQLATITGFVVASGAITAGASSMFYGRWARPENTRLLLLIALMGGAACTVLLAFSNDWIQVAVLQLVLGLLAGGTASLGFAYGLRLAPPNRSAATLSILASSAQFGGALSAVLVGLVSQAGLRYAFLASAGAYLIAAALTALPARDAARPERPDQAPSAQT
jgi:DHA1 family multidrug resistance protein-like MFS transporter